MQKDLNLVVLMDEDMKKKDETLKQMNKDLSMLVLMDDDMKKLQTENQELKSLKTIQTG